MKKNILALLSITLLTGCGNYEEFKESLDGGFSAVTPDESLSFQMVKEQVLEPRCTSCHAKYGVYEDVKANINAIVGMVRANVMPKDGPLTDAQKSLLFSWVNAGMPQNSTGSTPPTNPVPNPNPNPNPNPDPGNPPMPIPPEDRLTFDNLTQKVFQPHCIRCHGSFSDYATVKNKINAIVNMVRSDAMPLGGALPNDLKTLLFEWAAAGAPQDATGPTPNPNPNPNPVPVPQPMPLEPTYKSLNQHIFAKKCVACHNPSGRAAFLDLSSYEGISKARSWLFDFRRPERSDIIDEITDDEEPMPPRGSPFERVTQAEIQTLIQWIRNGIPNN